jgi:hypothetical protein
MISQHKDLSDRFDNKPKPKPAREYDRQWVGQTTQAKQDKTHKPKYPAPPRQIKTDPNVTWDLGLEVATCYELDQEYKARNGYGIDTYDSGFWSWTKHFESEITAQDWRGKLGWVLFQNECIDGSYIRPSMLALNAKHIVNSGYGNYEVLDTLNIPISVNYQNNENRPGLRFSGNLYAFVCDKTGFFNGKPLTPKWDDDKGKYRKYESARKNPGEEGNKVFYPNVDQEACDLLMLRYPELRNSRGGARINPGNYWKIILSHYPDASNIPLIEVGVDEGVKKAVCMTGQGYPTVAIYGVCNWSISGSSNPRVLLPELAAIAKGGREMPIWFDMDDPDAKISTYLMVKGQAHQLTEALIAAGADKKYTRPMFWDRTLGKGIDDAIASVAAAGGDIMDFIDHARQYSRQAEIYAKAAKCYKLAPDRRIERSTTGDYLPGDIKVKPAHTTAIISDTGSGKTHQIKLLRAEAKAAKKFTFVLPPTNALGRQLSHEIGLPHRHDCTTDSQLITKARQAGGLVLCPDSLHLAQILLKDESAAYIVVLDEAAKVLEHVTVGATLKERNKFNDVNSGLADLLKRAESVILAEAKLSEADLVTVEQMSGKSTLLYTHQKITAKRDVKIYEGATQVVNAAATNDLLNALKANKKTLICTDSQRHADRLERMILESFPSKKGLRVDSTTAWESAVGDVISDPNKYLADNQLDWLIYTPITKAGWDLRGFYADKHGVKHKYQFDHIFAFFAGLPTSDHVQLIARYRPNVPVTIACPPLITTQGDEASFTKKELNTRIETITDGAIAETQVKRGDDLPLQAVINNLYKHNTLRNGWEKSIANYSIWQRLKDDGHTVTMCPISMADLVTDDPELYDRLKVIQDQLIKLNDVIDRDWADLMARIKLSPDDDQHEAVKLEKLDCPTPLQRAKAAKIRLCGAFRDVDFDNAETVYYTTRKYSKLAGGVDRHAKLSFTDLVAARQIAENTAILSKPIMAQHHLSYKRQSLELLLQVGLLDLLETEYCKTSPEMLMLQAKCVSLAKEFRYYMGLDFKPTDGVMSVLSRLVSKLALSLEETRREGVGGRLRYYQVVNHDLLFNLVDKTSARKVELEAKLEDHTGEMIDSMFPLDLAATPTPADDDWLSDAKKLERTIKFLTSKIERLLDKSQELDVRSMLYTGAVTRLSASSDAVNNRYIDPLDVDPTIDDLQDDYRQIELPIPLDPPDPRVIITG